MEKLLVFILLFIIKTTFIWSQAFDDLRNYNHPEFAKSNSEISEKKSLINLDCNQFAFFSEKSTNWFYLYTEIQKMITKKDRKLNFYHIGGSHIQADIYTHDFRTFLQSNWPGLNGERGLVFPFGLASTNNPSNYNFSSPNNWTGFRSVSARPEDLQYGLTGAAIKCADSLIVVNFKHMRSLVKPPFNRLRIYHNTGEFFYDMNFGSQELFVTDTYHHADLGYSEIRFSDKMDSLDIQFIRTCNIAASLEIYGFEFLNDLPGITYNAIGINGAGLYTYLGNEHFLRDLKIHPPDFFAFSLGTNDAYTSYENFNPQKYKENLEEMIKLVLTVNPKCAILLTVPNDCLFNKKHLNKNTNRQREVIYQLAAKYEQAVWDFYGIMGELGSSKSWKENGLMQNDYVHFTAGGYHIKGSLLIDAFLKYLLQFDKLSELKKLN
jgi:lysophospholipase L1-like esterase